MIEANKIHQGDALKLLRECPDNFVDMCCTSPPYYGLRDYKIEKTKWEAITYSILGFEVIVPAMECCLGLESSPKEFIGHLVAIFREVKRVLKKEGTIWINIGDSYEASGKNRTEAQAIAKSTMGGGTTSQCQILKQQNKITKGLKAKDLIGIPWMLAYALRDDGWFLRQDCIWHKPNPMPESVTDRCTKSHEYIFLLSKSKKYYYDAQAIATPYQDKTLTTYGCEVKGRGDGSGMVQSENWAASMEVRKPKVWKTPDGWDTSKGDGGHGTIHPEGRAKGKSRKEKIAESYGLNGTGFSGHSGNYDPGGNLIGTGKANKRSVWTVNSQAYAEAHFATFPEDLVVDMIKAGCPEGGIVLDPFGGAGTTALVAAKLNRKYLLFELKDEYVKLADKRLQKELGLFYPGAI